MSELSPIVYIVDDDESVRQAIDRLLRSYNMQTRVYASAQEFLCADLPDRQCCLVLDVRLPGLSGLDLQREINNKSLDIPIIFITAHGDIPMTVRAMKAGAMEFLTKPFHEEELINAINQAMEQSRRHRQQQAEIAQLRNRYNSLTKREREVMLLVVAGLLNKQIAYQLGTSEATIKLHRGQVMRKMAAESIAELIGMATKLGLSQ